MSALTILRAASRDVANYAEVMEAIDALAKLVEAANKVQAQVAPLLESNGYISVGAMDRLRRALARCGVPA